MQKSLDIFISYAHEDEALRRELAKHLSPLKARGLIDVWHDRHIRAGAEWENEIDLRLNSANIILLLISPDFMASRYCYGIEMKRAIERHTRGEARVIPIILRPADWQISPLGGLQALPRDAKPITLWQNRDAAFLDVSQGIRSVAKDVIAELTLQQLTPRRDSDQNLTFDAPNYPQPYEYQEPWSRGSRGLLLILLDQSETMNRMTTLGGRTATVAEITTSFANGLIQEIIDSAGLDEQTFRRKDVCDIAVYGYSDQVMPLLNRTGSPISLPELADAPLGLHSLFQYSYNPVKGQLEKSAVRVPYWFRPFVRETQSDMAAAVSVTNQVILSWIGVDARRARSPAPLVLNITGARHLRSGSNPIEEAAKLRQIRTRDGATLLFNYYFSPSTQHFLVFPHDVGQLENLGLSDEERFVAEQLFHMSSIVPYALAKNAADLFRKAFPFDARGSLYNADGATVIDLLSWGTRVGAPRRWSRDVNVWPTTHQYDEALQHAYMAVHDQDIKNSPLLQDSSGPIHLNAKKDYVCVYRLGNWIVKCFVGNPPVDIRERYWAIRDYINLHNVQLPFLISQEWIEQGVRINRQDWPFIKSPFIRHIPLGTFLKNIVSQDGKQALISEIAKQWLDIITVLESLNIAHGDLDLTNVLVCGVSPNVTLGLIDFDSMYVPTLAGRQLWEQGHQHFQPTQSELLHFNNEMDRFSALIIYLSLIALAEDPLLWETCNAHEDGKLLLGAEDFRDLENSGAYQLLYGKQNNQELQKCLAELATSILESRMPRSLTEVLHSPDVTSASTLFGFLKLSSIPTNMPQLPTLFENDPLYATPSPAKSRLFIYTKGNAQLENCESAYAFSPDETRFALSEGIGAFARAWAALLSRLWVEQPFINFEVETFNERLHGLQKDWEYWIYNNWLSSINKRNYKLGRPEFSQQDAERYVAQGASATLLNVVLDQTKTTWSAFAIGDTCLFHLSRRDTSWEVRSFPPETSTLTSEPASVRSHSMDFRSLTYQQMSGMYAPGDVLLLATNEIAKWLLKQVKQRSIKWSSLLGLNSEKDFISFVSQQRSMKQMNDEDIILIIIPL